MKIVAISQRVEEIKDYGEIRDALDEQWHNLFWEMDAALVPIPNYPASIGAILERIHPEAIVLSGGNNPVEYGGTMPQRDRTDELLIQYSIEKSVPLLGVCRGMQSVAMYFGSTLKKVEGHIAVKHEIKGEIEQTVNSYHAYAIDVLGSGLRVTACTRQGDIEAIQHKQYPIYGIMWHPERGDVFYKTDIKFIMEKLSIQRSWSV